MGGNRFKKLKKKTICLYIISGGHINIENGGKSHLKGHMDWEGIMKLTGNFLLWQGVAPKTFLFWI